jgi:hypothetical protein
LLGKAKHDFYHLPSFVALEAKRLSGEGGGVLLQDGPGGVLFPVVVRSLDVLGYGHLRDATSPYGYPGPITWGPPLGADRIGAALRLCLEDLGVCSVFIRMHPLLEGNDATCLPPEWLVQHGETVWVDLEQSDEDIWHETRPRVRTQLRALSRAGYSAHIEEDWRSLDRFKDIYWATMRRVGARSEYFFSGEYFDELRQVLKGRSGLCVVERDGAVVSAGVFSLVGEISQYHLGCTADEVLRDGPSRLMFDAARWWARNRGAKVLHLGGGLGNARDSLFEFKAGFSKRRARFSTAQVVTSSDVYQTAVNAWKARKGIVELPSGAFFPAYRTPDSSAGD